MSNIKPGDTVTYVSARKGNRKVAIVTATPESLTEGTSLTLEEGHINLAVFSPTGSFGPRQSVPTKDIFEANKAKADANHEDAFEFDGEDEASDYEPTRSYTGYFEV